MPPLYLDYNATTPLDLRVFEAMKPWFLEEPGNAGSRTHIFGQRAKDAVEKARGQVASVLGAQPGEIIFTSGATESNNLVLLGLARYGEQMGRRHIIASAIEHKAILEPLDELKSCGFDVDLAPVTSGGYVEPEAVERLLRKETLLVSIMHANNETGVLQPVLEIAELLRDRDVFFHTDAAQTFGKEVETLKRLRCDFLSISGHKIYGPKGIGGLYVRRRSGARCPIAPLLYGGGQERGLRPGTIPVPLVIGLGEAATLAEAEFNDRRRDARAIREELLQGLRVVEHCVNGDLSRSQSHIINVSFPGVDSEAFMMATCEQIAVSNGSACTSTSYSPSHVLLAMGFDEERVESAVRMSWGLGVQQIPVDSIVDAVESLRG